MTLTSIVRWQNGHWLVGGMGWIPLAVVRREFNNIQSVCQKLSKTGIAAD
ncbi:hypothetical protein [Posidoniimonas corsicana]|nr:hypothetical protein [Posidoniimonas corsicana]